MDIGVCIYKIYNKYGAILRVAPNCCNILQCKEGGIDMRFLTKEEIKKGMVLARPIYNKAGVLLYDVGTKLTKPGLNNIENFGLIGAYFLEPTEPLPVITEEDREFERFQTMTVLKLEDYIKQIIAQKGAKGLEQLADEIIRHYGKNNHKINFLKSVRSPEDYVCKHSVNVAILCAIISAQIKLPEDEQRSVVMAAFLHELGKAMVPMEILKKSEKLSDADMFEINRCEIAGNELIQQDPDLPPATRIIIAQHMKELSGKSKQGTKLLTGTKILRVADAFDSMTAMGLAGEPYSEVVAIRFLINDKQQYDDKIVGALLSGIKVLNPGVCVELTSGERGLVIRSNDADVLRPTVLGLRDNKVYELDHSNIQIHDVLKTLDHRVPLRPEAVEAFLEKKNKI